MSTVSVTFSRHGIRSLYPWTFLSPPHRTSAMNRQLSRRTWSLRTFSTTCSRGNTQAGGQDASQAKPLHGTVSSHRSYIFLHTLAPPSAYPVKISSPVQRALLLKAAKWGGIVNFSYLESRREAARKGRIPITAFSAFGQRLEIPDISLENLDEIEHLLLRHANGTLVEGTLSLIESTDEVQIYVCTHGARDCRCGDTGGAVARALKEEITRRVASDPSSPARRIEVGEVGHVGQHHLAANVLIYPHGEWLGLIKPENVPELVDSVLKLPTPSRNSFMEHPPLLPAHWRGRMGLNKEEQLEHLARWS